MSSMATQAIVFYIFGLDGKWKSPVAYYFTNQVAGKRLWELLKDVLKPTHEFETIVRSVVFDGLAANIGMTTEVGANLKYSSSSTLTKKARTGRRTAALKTNLPGPTTFTTKMRLDFVSTSTYKKTRILRATQDEGGSRCSSFK
jgi:hypothetical protein